MNCLTTHFLDRASLKRTEENWIKNQFNGESARIILISDSKVLCTSTQNPKAVYLTRDDLDDISEACKFPTFLGIYDKKTYFAIGIESEKIAYNLSRKKNGEFIDLKQVIALFNYRDSGLLTLAQFMINWNLENHFCGKCGNPTITAQAGNVRICENSLCKQSHFPSMDPAIIVLVSSGEYCLLGRQPNWPDGLYSTIAGFIEPGESIEDAVMREVEEETGIEIKEIEYQSSQPWLFPSSLMLGFTAKAKTKKIKVAENELEDARWFSREEIKYNLDNKLMILPLKVSIAYNLIKEWYDKGDAGKLNTTHKQTA
jgi:NAD+ diphosphatase